MIKTITDNRDSKRTVKDLDIGELFIGAGGTVYMKVDPVECTGRKDMLPCLEVNTGFIEYHFDYERVVPVTGELSLTD